MDFVSDILPESDLLILKIKGAHCGLIILC